MKSDRSIHISKTSGPRAEEGKPQLSAPLKGKLDALPWQQAAENPRCGQKGLDGGCTPAVLGLAQWVLCPGDTETGEAHHVPGLALGSLALGSFPSGAGLAGQAVTHGVGNGAGLLHSCCAPLQINLMLLARELYPWEEAPLSI